MTSSEEQLLDNRAIEVWSRAVEPYGGSVGDFGPEGQLYLTGRFREDGISADLRLHKRNGGYMIYVNDFHDATGKMDEQSLKGTFVRVMTQLIERLKLEGVSINFFNVQGAYDNSKEYRDAVLTAAGL